MTNQASIHTAQTEISRLTQEALTEVDSVSELDQQSLVQLSRAQEVQPQRRLGGAAGTVLYIADDFDAPLDDFLL